MSGFWWSMATSKIQATDSEIILNGLNYLKSQQDQETGKINGFGGESDWAGIAFSANGIDVNEVNGINEGSASLGNFLRTDLPGDDSPATLWERKILSIVAIGENPADFGGVNFVENLENLYSENQIGDSTAVNDDIFGILALIASGPLASEEILSDALGFVISHQDENGGFSWTTQVCDWCGADSNDTSSAIQALVASKDAGLEHPDLENSLEMALEFLLTMQNEDGGFGYDGFSDSDGSSTAWALMALNVLDLDESPEAVKASAWLASNQNPDGGFHYQADFGSDASTTSHAVIALSGKSWLLNIFDPEKFQSSNPTPTPQPSPSPTLSPISKPTPTPTPKPTATPTPSPTPEPTPTPVPTPTPMPTSATLSSLNSDEPTETQGEVLGEQTSNNEQISDDEQTSITESTLQNQEATATRQIQTSSDQRSARTQQSNLRKNIFLTLASFGGMVLLFVGLRIWEGRSFKRK